MGDSVDNDNEEALWSTFAYLLKIKVRCRFDLAGPTVESVVLTWLLQHGTLVLVLFLSTNFVFLGPSRACPPSSESHMFSVLFDNLAKSSQESECKKM